MLPIRTLVIAKGESSLGISFPPSAPNFSGVGCCLVLMPVLLSAMFQECCQSFVNTASRKEERGCSKNSGDKSMGCLGTVTASCVEEGWVMHSVLFWLLSCWLLETVLRWQQKLVIFSMSLSSVTAPLLGRVQLPSYCLWTAFSNGMWAVMHRKWQAWLWCPDQVIKGIASASLLSLALWGNSYYLMTISSSTIKAYERRSLAPTTAMWGNH